jgi:hypothetical protein
MSLYLVITIDVEPDCTTSWQYSDPLTFHGVSKGVKERLQPLFIKHNVVPTYLLNNVVLEDEQSVRTFSGLEGEFELGSHLHPEFIEPQRDFSSYAGKRGLANSCEYAPEVEYEKIKNYTDLFTSRFNLRPTSFRAGRFSAGPNTISSLNRLGYKVDTSVTPNILWDDETHKVPVDFSRASEQPYFVKDGTILEEDPEGKILEVPVSIVEAPATLIGELKRTYFGTRGKIKKMRPIWLRPVYSTNRDLRFVVDQISKSDGHRHVTVINMMFHNVEVMPGMSPYAKTESDCKAYLRQLEMFFEYCRTKDVQSVALTDLYDLQERR